MNGQAVGIDQVFELTPLEVLKGDRVAFVSHVPQLHAAVATPGREATAVAREGQRGYAGRAGSCHWCIRKCRETLYTGVKDNVFAQAHPARLCVPGRLFVYELSAYKAYGDVRTAEFTSEPVSGKLFACLPFAIKNLKVSAEVKDGVLKIAGKVATSSPMKEEAMAAYVEAFRPDGSRQYPTIAPLTCERACLPCSSRSD